MTGIVVPPIFMRVANDVATGMLRSELTSAERHEMLLLLQSHFEGVTELQFDADLDSKDWVLRITRDDALVGFSTVKAYTTTVADRSVNVIYSGDTVMAPEAWGSPILSRGWITLVRMIEATRPGEPWHWLLLSSGFRTYRFLPVFWREFWPRYDREPDEQTRHLMHTLAVRQFGACYDRRAGVVRFARPQRLRQHLAAVPEGRENDPHIRFFLQRNPGHARGDELVCFAELGDSNLTAAGQRMVRIPK